MMRRALLLGLLSAATARPFQSDQVVKLWNRFARDSREFFQTVDVNPAEHSRKKEQLRTDFEAVFPLL